MKSQVDVKAPLTGVVIEVHAQIGQQIKRGDLLVLMESMKVQIRIEAEHTGTVDNIWVSAGHSSQRDAVLLTLNIEEQHSEIVEAKLPHSVQAHPLIAEYQDRKALTLDDHRKEALKKRHDRRCLSARENLANLCKLDSFQEYGQFAVAAQRNRHDYQDLKTTTAADGIITGIGQVNGQATAIIVNDYSVLAGTQGYFHHQKLDRILSVAEQKKLPVIMFTEGGGGRPGDTDVTIINSGLQCRSFGTWAGLSGSVPRISVANGYNFAGNAALFGAADITIATESSWIGMAGPAMIEGGGLGVFKPTEIGPIDIQAANGTVDIVVKNETEAASAAIKVLSYFQTGEATWKAPEQHDLDCAMPQNRRQTYAIRNIIDTIFDTNSCTELRHQYGRSIVTCLATLEGKAIGIMASDCEHLGGAIDVDAGEKATRFMQLCDQFNLPIVSLCDTPGFMVGPEHETLGAVRKLADMFRVGAKLSTPFHALILRKCYGLGAQAMLGGSTHRPLATLSWPTGEFGPMGLEGAVRLGYKKELEAFVDVEQEQALFDKLLAQQYEKGKASEVASVLEIDAVISPSDSRAALISLIGVT